VVLRYDAVYDNKNDTIILEYTTKMSYIIPYSIVGTSAGMLLSLATGNPMFTPIMGLAGSGYGMIRNNNRMHNNQTRNNPQSCVIEILNTVIKGITIYIFGPSLVVFGSFLILMIAIRS
jgi:hypothetical protein